MQPELRWLRVGQPGWGKQTQTQSRLGCAAGASLEIEVL